MYHVNLLLILTEVLCKNICELPDGHKTFPEINISVLSGRHCGPHPSSIK